MENQIPTIGRIVHYVSHGSPVLPDGTQAYPSVLRPAIITEISPNQGSDRWQVTLMVCNPEGIFFKKDVRQGDEGGQWNWPVRA
jgi:hypothetical protein